MYIHYTVHSCNKYIHLPVLLGIEYSSEYFVFTLDYYSTGIYPFLSHDTALTADFRTVLTILYIEEG